MPAQAIAAVFGAQTSPFAAALISAVCSTHFVIAHALSHAAGASAPAPVASAVRRSCHWWDLAQLGELGHAAGAAAPAPGALAHRRSPLRDLAQPGKLGPSPSPLGWRTPHACCVARALAHGSGEVLSHGQVQFPSRITKIQRKDLPSTSSKNGDGTSSMETEKLAPPPRMTKRRRTENTGVTHLQPLQHHQARSESQ